MIDTKTCPGCEAVLSIAAFNKDKYKEDGLQSRCRGCYKVERVARYNDTPPVTGCKTCPQCKETKPIEAFRKNKAKNDGLASYCTACDKIRDTARHARRAANFDLSKTPKHRVCPRCGEDKPRDCFAIYKGSSNGLASYCKQCQKKWKTEKREEHAASFDVDNIPDYKTCSHCKMDKARDEFNVNKYSPMGLRTTCRSCANILAATCRTRLKEQDIVGVKIKDMINAARQRAKKGGLPFDLDVDYIRSIITMNCPVFCLPFDFYSEKPSDMSPSIDQFRAGQGYTKGHVRVISYKANRMKSDGTTKDVKQLAEWMVMTEGEIDAYELS